MDNDSERVGIIHLEISSSPEPEVYQKNIGDRSAIEWIIRRANEVFSRIGVIVPGEESYGRIYKQSIQWADCVYRRDEGESNVYEKILDHFSHSKQYTFVPGDNIYFPSRNFYSNLKENESVGLYGHTPVGIEPFEVSRDGLKAVVDQDNIFSDANEMVNGILRDGNADGVVFRPPQEFRAPGFDLSLSEEIVQFSREFLDSEKGLFEEISPDKTISLLSEKLSNNQNRSAFRVSSPRSILFCLNRGGGWGTGHWYRYRRISSVLRDSLDSVDSLYLLLGNRSKGDDFEQKDRVSMESQSVSVDHSLAVFDDELTDENIKEWQLRSGSPLIILDRKQSGKELVNTLEEQGSKVIGIEERGEGRSGMEAVFDPNLYDKLPNDKIAEKKRFYGARYALISSGFSEFKKDDPPRKIERVGMFFGGSDPNNYGKKFVQSVVSRFPEFDFTLFGPQASDQIGNDPPLNLQDGGIVENVAERFSKFDFMIISGGIIKFEVACLRIPSMIIPQNDEQLKNSRRFLNQNDINWTLCEGEDPMDWVREMQKFKNKKRLQESFYSTESVVDGKGIQRFLRVVQKEIEE